MHLLVVLHMRTKSTMKLMDAREMAGKSKDTRGGPLLYTSSCEIEIYCLQEPLLCQSLASKSGAA